MTTTATSTSSIPTHRCPRCGAALDDSPGIPTACPKCRWRGRLYRYNPPPRRAQTSELAFEGQATCAHHPDKQATAICTGTGDYICPLCAVEIDGRVYAAQYIDRVGLKTIDSGAAPELGRPDRMIHSWFVLSVLFVLLSPMFFGLSIYSLIRMFAQRSKDPFYRRLVYRSRVITAVVLTVLNALLAVLGVFLIIRLSMEP